VRVVLARRIGWIYRGKGGGGNGDDGPGDPRRAGGVGEGAAGRGWPGKAVEEEKSDSSLLGPIEILPGRPPQEDILLRMVISYGKIRSTTKD
jgi:hypothetical protein